MLRGLFSKQKKLVGAQSQPRMKTYAASSGYVYHYYFEGRTESGECEYVFKISTGHSNWRLISIVVPMELLGAWRSIHPREITASDRYAVAKLALFDMLDQCAVPEAMPGVTRVTRAALDAIAGALGWE